MNSAKFLLLSLLLIFSGCSEQSMEASFTKALTGAVAARQTITVQHKFGRISDDKYLSLLNTFKKIDIDLNTLADDLAVTGMITSTNKVIFLERLDKLIATVSSLRTTEDFLSSPKARSIFNSSVISLRAGLRTARNIIAATTRDVPITHNLIDLLRKETRHV